MTAGADTEPRPLPGRDARVDALASFEGGVLALLDYGQAAPLLGCSPRMVRKLVDTRQLASVKVGRLVRIHPDDVAAYIERQRRDAAV